MTDGNGEQHPPSMAVMRRKRLFEAFKTVIHEPDYGSLWWVDDAVWRRYVRALRSEKKHPGLCIQRVCVNNPLERVSMLFGTSQAGWRLLLIRDITLGGRATYFGAMGPARMVSNEFLAKSRIQRNTHKPALDEEEKQRLSAWIVVHIPQNPGCSAQGGRHDA